MYMGCMRTPETPPSSQLTNTAGQTQLTTATKHTDTGSAALFQQSTCTARSWERAQICIQQQSCFIKPKSLCQDLPAAAIRTLTLGCPSQPLIAKQNSQHSPCCGRAFFAEHDTAVVLVLAWLVWHGYTNHDLLGVDALQNPSSIPQERIARIKCANTAARFGANIPPSSLLLAALL